VQDVKLKALTGVDHNTELAQKAQRRVEALLAVHKQESTAEPSYNISPAAQQALQHLLGGPNIKPSALAKPSAAVLLADIVSPSMRASSLHRSLV